MYKEGKVYVPKDEKLRAEIIRLHHDTPIGGHGGQWKMVKGTKGILTVTSK